MRGLGTSDSLRDRGERMGVASVCEEGMRSKTGVIIVWEGG